MLLLAGRALFAMMTIKSKNINFGEAFIRGGAIIQVHNSHERLLLEEIRYNLPQGGDGG